MVNLLLTYLVHFALSLSTVAAQTTSSPTSYPSATSSPTLVQQSFAYNPSKAAAGIFAGLYAIATVILFIRLFANRAWWGLCLPIGSAVMSAGFVLRIVMIIYPNSLAFLLCSMLFILLSPTAFLAYNYILYGRFVVNCVQRRYSLIRPERTARYFVISDVTTFLVQGVGGSFLSSTSATTDKIGDYVIIGGLALQTLSFGIFILLVYYAFQSLNRSGARAFEAPWGNVFKLLFFSSAMFLLRCIYRTIEFAQGLGEGYLVNHEAFFYVFDSLPLLVGILTYAVDWPSRYLLMGSEASTLLPTASPTAFSSTLPLPLTNTLSGDVVGERSETSTATLHWAPSTPALQK